MTMLAACDRVLVIAPHADDEVLACGGTMARLADQGAEVFVQFMTVDGFHHYGLDGTTTFDQRVAEIEDVAALLSFEWDIAYGDQDLIEKLDTVPKRDLVDRFEQRINDLEPDLVLVPSGADYDQDHVATFETAIAALRPISPAFGKWLVPQVLVYESPKIMWWVDDIPRPEAFVDISEVIDRKQAALAAYVSQARPSPHIRSPEAVAALACLRGKEIGVDHAEAFSVLRTVL
ncbi:MAG: PIG-L deacetylase family protein [Actinomycetota bacterium]